MLMLAHVFLQCERRIIGNSEKKDTSAAASRSIILPLGVTRLSKLEWVEYAGFEICVCMFQLSLFCIF